MVQAQIIKNKLQVQAAESGDKYVIIGTDGNSDWQFQEGRAIFSVIVKGLLGGLKEKKTKEHKITHKDFKKGTIVKCNFTGKGGPERNNLFEIESVKKIN